MILPNLILQHNDEEVLKQTEAFLRSRFGFIDIKIHGNQLAILFADQNKQIKIDKRRLNLNQDIKIISFNIQKFVVQQIMFTEEELIKIQIRLQKNQELKQNNTQLKYKIVCSIDFQAYLQQPLILSEIGVVRMENNKIVALLHCFFEPDETLSQHTNDSAIAHEIQLKTKIFCPNNQQYEQVKPRFILNDDNTIKFAELLETFCTKSSNQITTSFAQQKLNVKLHIFSEFQTSIALSYQTDYDNNDFIILSKDTKLEEDALNNIFKSPLANFLQEARTYYNKITGNKLSNKELRSPERQFNCCWYHDQQKRLRQEQKEESERQILCALDISIYVLQQIQTF